MADGNHWIRTLLLITLIHTATFISLSVYQFISIGNTRKSDAQLQTQIDFLQAKLNDNGAVRSRREADFVSSLLHSQEQILAQHCISGNKTCQAGSNGEAGADGPIGMKGTKGENGLIGLPGAPGSPGIKGQPGLDGLKGQKGEIGLDGDSGIQGVKGQTGEHGAVGKPGLKGDPGIKGRLGPAGSKGIKGMPGLVGDGGANGRKGPTGGQGVQGRYGPHGVKGEKGSDFHRIPKGCPCWAMPVITNTFDGLLNHTKHAHSGDDVIMSCTAIGVPPPLINYFFEGKELKRCVAQVDNNCHVMQNITTADSGTYTCKASNMAGTVESSGWHITVA